MALEIKWTKQAEKGLDHVIKYLETEWTIKEILLLETKLKNALNQIVTNPELFPKSEYYKDLHKVIIDKNNYLVYKINNSKGRIEIINFRGTKQKPKH